MATVRAALRTSALHDHHLAELMTRTNQVLAIDNRHKRFVTLSLLLIDADTRMVRWASAGHDGRRILCADQMALRLDAGC